MRLLSPYIIKTLIQSTEVYITRQDIVKFQEELPEGVVGPFDPVTPMSENILFASYTQGDFKQYEYKSIILKDSEKILGIINLDQFQDITCKVLSLRITFIQSQSKGEELTADITLLPYVDSDNKFYKPTEESPIVTTPEESLENNGNLVNKYISFKGNDPFTSPFDFLSIGEKYNIQWIIPNVIGGVPCLAIRTADNQFSIDLKKKKIYCIRKQYIKGLQFVNSKSFEQEVHKDLVMFLDTETGKDLLLGQSIYSINEENYLFGVNYGTDIFVINKDEEQFLGKSFQDISVELSSNGMQTIDKCTGFIGEEFVMYCDYINRKILIIDKIAGTSRVENMHYYFLFVPYKSSILYKRNDGKFSSIDKKEEYTGNIPMTLFGRDYLLIKEKIIIRNYE